MNRDDFQLVKLIHKLEIFQGLSGEEALEIIRMGRRRSFAREERVWSPDDPGVDMLVLLSGKLHVSDKAGALIGQVLPGGVFGEMACLSGTPRYFGFQAAESSTALSFSRVSLTGLVESKPQVYVSILEAAIKILARRAVVSFSGQRDSGASQSASLSW